MHLQRTYAQRERAGRAGGAGGGGDGPDRGGARRPGRPHPGAYTLVNTDTQAVVVVVVVVVVARRTGRPHPGAYTVVVLILMRYTDAPVVARRPKRPHHTQVLTRQ